MEPKHRIELSLTDRAKGTLYETIEIALGQAQDALVTHQVDDSPRIGESIEKQLDDFALQIELVDGAKARIDDLNEIASQLEGGSNDG